MYTTKRLSINSRCVQLISHCVENKAGKLTKAERQIDDLSSLAFDAAYDCEDIFAQSPHRLLPYLDRMKILKLGMASKGQALLLCGSHSFTTWPERYNAKIKWKETCLLSHRFLLLLGSVARLTSNIFQLPLWAKYQLVGLLKRSPRMELALAPGVSSMVKESYSVQSIRSNKTSKVRKGLRKRISSTLDLLWGVEVFWTKKI